MKGMAYTPFAIMASGLLISLMMMPYSGMDLQVERDADMIGQAAFYHSSIHNDADRAYGIAFDRALSGATSRVVSDGISLDQPREDVASAVVNGTIDGEQLNYTFNSSMEGWQKKVERAANNAGYRFNATFPVVRVGKETEFIMESNATMRSRLHDPSLRLYLNRSSTSQIEHTIEGLEDPYLRVQTSDFYGHIFSKCSFNSLATDLGESNQDSGSLVWGRAVIEPVIGANTTYQNRILVADDVEADYTPDQVQNFEAFITADQVTQPGDYNDHYMTQFNAINSISANISIVMDSEQLYNTHFRDMIDQSCYLTSQGGNLNGPGFFQRLQNNGTADSNPGLVSLVDKDELQTVSTDSNVGYVFFSENPDRFGNTVEIRGVTFGESGSTYRNSFRIDQYHINQWNINELAQ